MIKIIKQKTNTIYYRCEECGAKGMCTIKPTKEDNSIIVIEITCQGCNESQRVTFVQYNSEENKKLKAEKAQLESQNDKLKIDKSFLQNQIGELNKKLNDLNAVVLEQIKVIMSLVTQLKETLFEKVFSPFNSA